MTDEVHSSTRLADALEAEGFPLLAKRARKHEFHDFLSPHAMPQHELVEELRERSDRVGLITGRLIDRVTGGEFDASKEEADEWAASPEGQAIMDGLTASSHAPETGILDGNHALLVGHVVGALMRLTAESGTPTVVEPVEAGPRIYTNKIAVSRPSGAYIVTVEKKDDAPPRPKPKPMPEGGRTHA